MSNTKQSSTERAKLQGLWRAAAKRESPLEVPCPTLAVARNLRFALYNAVRAERDQPELADAGLAEALETISLSVEDNPPRLVLRRKVLIELLDSVISSIPELAELSVDAVDLQAADSLRRLEERLKREAAGQPSPPGHAADSFRGEQSKAAKLESIGKPNPFYTRDPHRPGSSS